MKVSSSILLSPNTKDSTNLLTVLQTESRKTPRSEIVVSDKKGQIQITVTAEDATSFRSHMNALCQLFSIYEKAEKLS